MTDTTMDTAPVAPQAALTKKDFMTDQEVRWCPGCGDYAILAAVQRTMPELNAGQLAMLLRARFLVDAISLSKIQGQPFKVSEIRTRIDELLRGREA